ncbi:MAG: T9SS C-terminal target domain-containing protein [Bacteroidetes bacterium]|nr:MAG: T9SS C-terminal target domain-containing protein [Bacteroidota bacterium]
MKYALSLLLALGLLAFLPAQTIERSVIGAAGTSLSSASYEVDFTVGEAVVTTVESGSFVLTQGFQQGDLATTGIDLPLLTVDYRLYPNPTTDRVQLDLESARPVTLHLQWFDARGRQVDLPTREVQVSGASQTLSYDLSSLATGTYMLRLATPDGREGHTFRVVRN